MCAAACAAPTTCSPTAPTKAPEDSMDDIHLDNSRRQALSRARGIANEVRLCGNQRYRLQGISQGDVLDWSDAGLFLAVTGASPAGLRTEAVSQSDPWGSVRDISMAAYALYLRLNHGWLCKVPPLRM
jgi:hypothetical protein